MNYHSMTDEAIASEIGRRIEQLRLEQNITQQQLADSVGISRVSYAKLVAGQAKFTNIIATLRALNQLEAFEGFLPDDPFSPMEQLKLQKRKRRRASGPRSADDRTGKGEAGLDW